MLKYVLEIVSNTYGKSLLLKNELGFVRSLLAFRFKLDSFLLGPQSNFFFRFNEELKPLIINTLSVISRIAGTNRISN